MKKPIKLKLKTLTPVFIGSGENYPACQIVKFGSSYYRLRENSFLETVQKSHWGFEENLLGKMLNYSVKNVEKMLNKEDLWYEMKNDASLIEGEIKELIRHPSGDIYIPGSSIKGAIRTAIQYCMVKRNQQALKDFLNSVKSKLSYCENQKVKKGEALKELSKVTKELDNELRLEKNDIHTDFARFLIVRDTNLLESETWIYRVGIFEILSGKLRMDQKKAQKEDKKKSTFLIEAIPAQVEFETEVIFDFDLLESLQKNLSKRFKFVPTSIEEIFDCVKEMFKDVVDDELKDLSEDHSRHKQKLSELSKIENKIHIGYGGGLKASSLFILLDAETRKRVRNIIENHGDDIAPLSRRSVTKLDNQPYLPLGWLTFELA